MCFRNSLKRSRQFGPARAPSGPQEKVRPPTILTALLFFSPLPARSKISWARPPPMRFRDYKIAVVAFLIFLGCAPGASLRQARRSKTVWSYDGGVFFATDGSLPNGVCFRVSGEMNAAEFFDHLKRVDDEHGTVFRRGPETVSQFPEALAVSFAIRSAVHARPQRHRTADLLNPGNDGSTAADDLLEERCGTSPCERRKGGPDPRRTSLSARHGTRGGIASALRVVLSVAGPQRRGASYGQSCIRVPDG